LGIPRRRPRSLKAIFNLSLILNISR